MEAKDIMTESAVVVRSKMKKEKLKYKKRKKRTPFQSILIDYDVATACDEAMERFTNSFAFSNFGLALQWFV